jgi:hypothetical protein
MGAANSAINSGFSGGNCHPGMLDEAHDAVAGYVTGVLNMVGLGFLTNPITPLQKNLTTAKSNLQTVYNTKGLIYNKNQNALNDYFLSLSKTYDSVLEDSMNLHDTIMKDEVGNTHAIMAFYCVLIIVVVAYLLLK